MIQDRIKELIRSLGLTTKAFADRVGAKQPAIQGIVTEGGSAPSWPTLEKILTALPEVSAEWLTRGIEPMFLDEEKQKAHETAIQLAASGSGSIQQANGSKNKLTTGTNTEDKGELTRLRAALDKCQDDKTELERELRKSKDKIIDLLESRQSGT